MFNEKEIEMDLLLFTLFPKEQLDHLFDFIPMLHRDVINEKVPKEIRELFHITDIEKWAYDSVNELDEWLKTLDDEYIENLTLDEIVKKENLLQFLDYRIFIIKQSGLYDNEEICDILKNGLTDCLKKMEQTLKINFAPTPDKSD